VEVGLGAERQCRGRPSQSIESLAARQRGGSHVRLMCSIVVVLLDPWDEVADEVADEGAGSGEAAGLLASLATGVVPSSPRSPHSLRSVMVGSIKLRIVRSDVWGQ